MESSISHGLVYIYSVKKDKNNKYPKIKLQAPHNLWNQASKINKRDHFKDAHSYVCLMSRIKRQLKWIMGSFHYLENNFVGHIIKFLFKS